jgi:phosphoserine phosphatase
MRLDAIDVFDLDGTLIRANSFREITKKALLVLLKKHKLKPVFILIGAFILRRMRVSSHLDFEKCAVNIFEKELTTREKLGICRTVFDENANRRLLGQMLASENCVISTASPYPYVSRMSFGKDVIVISPFDPNVSLPDAANLGEGKVKNLIAYFGNDKIRVVNFYTDSFADQPMIDFAENAFMCKNDHIQKIK